MAHSTRINDRWPPWGSILLIIPTAFVVGALSGHTPSWGWLQSPVVLLGSLGVAALGNLWSLIHVEVLKGTPPVLRIDIAGNAHSIIVLTIAGLLGAVLMGLRIRRKLHAAVAVTEGLTHGPLVRS
jgi:hypothetical protein